VSRGRADHGHFRARAGHTAWDGGTAPLVSRELDTGEW